MMDATLTGRRRYRVKCRLFGAPLVVLQVQERGVETVWAGGHVDTASVTRWRDAQPQDLTETVL